MNLFQTIVLTEMFNWRNSLCWFASKLKRPMKEWTCATKLNVQMCYNNRPFLACLCFNFSISTPFPLGTKLGPLTRLNSLLQWTFVQSAYMGKNHFIRYTFISCMPLVWSSGSASSTRRWTSSFLFLIIVRTQALQMWDAPSRLPVERIEAILSIAQKKILLLIRL